ncbi:MAG TPA: hypothetical protein VJU59_50955 [Paraburkholderia sp.]|uniref:hypothetical protein n=1 Tax=Paraburkholderia sp. TaxID=1926495 RepID=UPI002B47C501|nr:hypothetical protein [Paraburkholderia sp.]HKR47902.1 hypothetical protein [Paraburkholderia sp.]
MPQRLAALTLRDIALAGSITLFDARTQSPQTVPEGNVKPPAPLKPQLFLVEQYRLTSFKGDLARDEMIGSFSLSPHSELTYTLLSRTSTSSTSELTTTVMESQDTLAATQFNEHLKQSADARFGKNNSNYQMDANFHGEASVGFGSGSADAQLHVTGGTQEVREDLARSTESAIDSQISATNQFRSQRALSGSQTTAETSSTESRIEKRTRNDSSEPMNIGMFQLKEETITLLSLVDVLVAFRNTNPEHNRTVALRELDTLLDAVIASPAERKALKKQIRWVLDDIRDYRDEPHSILVPDPADPDGFMVNRRLESVYELKALDGTTRRRLSVPGIIIRDFRRYLRKPNTTVELRIGTI